MSAKVPKKLKQELDRSGVNISQAIRTGLESALRKRKVELLEKMLEQVDLTKLTKEQIVQDIRAGRERHTRR